LVTIKYKKIGGPTVGKKKQGQKGPTTKAEKKNSGKVVFPYKGDKPMALNKT